MRYEIRRTAKAWIVWDRVHNTPATLRGRWQTGLCLEDASEIVELMNRIEETPALGRYLNAKP